MRALALTTDETLLVLKLAFLVLLYGFIVLVVRSATKDLGGAPQESIILGPAEAARLRAEHGLEPARFVVEGPGRTPASTIEVITATVVGRDQVSGVRLDDDEFASGQHARIDPRPEGVWIDDLGSTNGTFVNGTRITARKLLQTGDVVKVGETELVLVS